MRLLDWAAVAGRDIDIALLVAQRRRRRRGQRASTCWRRRAGPAWSPIADPPCFTHDLYRDAILDGMPAATARRSISPSAAPCKPDRRPGRAARIAAHLLRAGPDAQHDAIDYSLQAAREATARLGHDDACAHYLRALPLLEDGDPQTIGVLLELAAAA